MGPSLSLRRLIVSLLSLSPLAGTAAAQVVRGEDTNQLKGIEWSPSKPESGGVDAAALEALWPAADPMPPGPESSKLDPARRSDALWGVRLELRLPDKKSDAR